MSKGTCIHRKTRFAFFYSSANALYLGVYHKGKQFIIITKILINILTLLAAY